VTIGCVAGEHKPLKRIYGRTIVTSSMHPIYKLETSQDNCGRLVMTSAHAVLAYVDQRLRNIDVFDLETPSFPSTQSGTVQEQQ
jgi:hypothetical protein